MEIICGYIFFITNVDSLWWKCFPQWECFDKNINGIVPNLVLDVSRERKLNATRFKSNIVKVVVNCSLL